MKINKKTAIILLVVAIALTGCGKKPKPTEPSSEPTVPVNTEPVAYKPPSLTPQYEYEEPEETYENGSAYEAFGGPLLFERTINDQTVIFSVNIPDDAKQIFLDEGMTLTHIVLDDNREFVVGYLDASSAATLKDVFPALLDTIESTMANGLTSENQIEIETSSIKDINGTEMAKVQIRLTVNNSHGNNSFKWKIIGYATELPDGGYAYYMAGGSIGNSRFIAIRQAAENMAFTFTEGGVSNE